MNLIRNIKKFLSLCAAIVLTVCCAYSSFAQEFIDGFEDIPIMDGLEQLPNDNISFGNEESRLVEAYLNGRKISFSSVASFYAETLPQLGWKTENKNDKHISFEREQERLDIVCEQTKPLLVRITLKSKN